MSFARLAQDEQRLSMSTLRKEHQKVKEIAEKLIQHFPTEA
jgi:hypothetical protein